MKAAVGPIVAGIVALLGLFGVNISEDVQAVVRENVSLVVSAIIALMAVLPSVLDAFKKKDAPPPDEHADVSRSQGGFARVKLLAVMAVVSVGVLAAGCASFQKGLSPDQRAAAVLIDAKAVANTCVDLYERDRIGAGDAQVCLFYVTQAIEMANHAHFVITTGDEKEQEGVEEILAQAEAVIKGLQEALATIAAEDKPASVQTSALENSVRPLGSFDALVGAYA